MTIERFATHLDDRDLVRHMDGEGTPEQRRRWDEHLDTCHACARDAATLRAASDAIRLGLEQAAFEATAAPATATTIRRPLRALPVWLKAAAAIVLLAAPLAALPPVRDWVASRMPGLQPAAPVPEAPSATPLVERIRFVPGPGEFAIVFATAQAAGALAVGRAPGAEALLELRHDGPPTPPVVSARGVRIDNRAHPGGSYRLLLPDRVAGLTVEVAGAALRVDGGELDRGGTVRLDRARPAFEAGR